jgi:hypothetical protein
MTRRVLVGVITTPERKRRQSADAPGRSSSLKQKRNNQHNRDFGEVFQNEATLPAAARIGLLSHVC